ncbi:MAG: AmmeMemoRadiSam system radical SAM enzyme [Dehalococcoidia bacterium]|nr:AmmeMemoRadiSam system radical SAM enzyme [Dehalococcoidia bacterium]
MHASRPTFASEIREAMLYERLPGLRVRCCICSWRCIVNPGKLGVCRMRRNDAGVLNVLNYSLVSSAAVDPIEKKPLFHFFPGTKVFSLGTWGCNFHCVHCQNWEISCVQEPDANSRTSIRMSPAEAIGLAVERGCSGIAWTYNEPTMWFEYTLDSARLARKAGLYSVYVTNGYITPEALDEIGPYLDAWRVDIKGFSDDLYRDLAGVPHWRDILDIAQAAKNKWGMHVEVVTNVIPTMNDDDEQLTGIAQWIHNSLGEATPWHVTRFHPQYNLRDKPPTPVATLVRALDIGRHAGLRFVYVGNVPGHDGENTVCQNCGHVVVFRRGYETRVIGLDGSACKFCRADLNFRLTSKRDQGGETS